MLTSMDIKNATFGRAGRGYKTADVDMFLDRVVETIDKLNAENHELLQKMGILAEKIKEYRKDEDSIHNALLTAQRSADQIMKEANDNAEKIAGETKAVSDEALAAAKKKAEEMLKDAQEKSIALVNETKEKAAMVLAEAKQKADNMIKEAEEACKIENQQFEATKKQAAEFRAALMDMYRQQFELMKKGPAVEYIPEIKEEPKDVEEITNDETIIEEFEDREANFVSPEDIPLPIAEKPTDDDYEEDDSALDNGIKDGFSLNTDNEEF